MSLACPSSLVPRAQSRLVARLAHSVVLASVATLVGVAALTGLAVSAGAQDNPGAPGQSIYTCPPGATLDGSSCITHATSLWVPGEYKAGTSNPVGSCPPGWELDGIFCFQASAAAQQTCPEGGAPDPEAPAADGTIGRCVADAVAQPQCPADYIAVDGTCFAEPIDPATCPPGGEADPEEIADDGSILACQAQPNGTANECPTNYVNTDGVCTAAPLEADPATSCPEGELVDGRCRVNAKFMSGPNATCDGEPTTKPATECGTWELKGGQRVPATVNTQPTAVPVPMGILGGDVDAPLALTLTPTPTPPIVLESLNTPSDSFAVQSPQIDLTGGGDAPASATPGGPAITLPTSPTATSQVATPTGSAVVGDSPNYEWGASLQSTPEPNRRPSLAFTGSAAKPLVVTSLALMVSGFMAVEFNRRLRKSDARKHLPRRFR